MTCEICGFPDDGLHFRRRTCRACAAFFRRSIVRNAVYTCKGNKDCVLTKELRKSCAACRLQKCRQIGMVEAEVQWCRDRNGPLKTARASTSTVSSSSSPRSDRTRTTSFNSNYSSGDPSSSLCSSPTALTAAPQASFAAFQPPPYTVGSTLQFLHSCIQDFFRCERAVYAMLYPDRNHIGCLEFYEASHTEMIQMDRALLSLIQQMIHKINPHLDALNADIKMQILKAFTNLFLPLHRGYLTALVFPSLDDQRFVCNYGQYTYCDTRFFEPQQDPLKALQMSDGIQRQGQHSVGKIKQLGMREIELAAISGIIFANEVEFILHDNSQSELRDGIYRELHENIAAFYPPPEVPHRFGALICLVQDMQLMAKEIDEALTMFNVFHPCLLNLWE